MLFCNIDHLDDRLLPITRRAGYRFFCGAAAMQQMFAHMELGVASIRGQVDEQQKHEIDIQQQAALAAWMSNDASENLVASASMFQDLALAIERECSYINNEIRNKTDLFLDAARQIGIAENSSLIREISDLLLREKVEGFLRNIAIEVSQTAARIRIIGSRILEARKVEDREYEEAQRLLGAWHLLVARGQFLSAICYIAARTTTKR